MAKTNAKTATKASKNTASKQNQALLDEVIEFSDALDDAIYAFGAFNKGIAVFTEDFAYARNPDVANDMAKAEELRKELVSTLQTMRNRIHSRPREYYLNQPTTSKRPTAKKASEDIDFFDAVKDLEILFSNAYGDLYEGLVEESHDMMEAGEELVKTRPNLFRAFFTVHGDFLTSDREMMAYYLALKRSKHQKILYSVDQVKKPTAKKTPAKKPTKSAVKRK